MGGNRSRKQAQRDFHKLFFHHGSRPSKFLFRAAKMWQCAYCQVMNAEKAVRCESCRGWWEECWIDTSGKTFKERQEGHGQRSNASFWSWMPWPATTPGRRIASLRAEQTTEGEGGSYLGVAKVKQQLEALKLALGDTASEEERVRPILALRRSRKVRGSRVSESLAPLQAPKCKKANGAGKEQGPRARQCMEEVPDSCRSKNTGTAEVVSRAEIGSSSNISSQSSQVTRSRKRTKVQDYGSWCTVSRGRSIKRSVARNVEASCRCYAIRRSHGRRQGKQGRVSSGPQTLPSFCQQARPKGSWKIQSTKSPKRRNDVSRERRHLRPTAMGRMTG